MNIYTQINLPSPFCVATYDCNYKISLEIYRFNPQKLEQN